MNTELPFELGSTYFQDNDEARLVSSYESVKYLLGQTFSIQANQRGDPSDSTKRNSDNFGSTETEVMVVRSSVAFTVDDIGLGFADRPNEVTGVVSDTGGFGYLADDELRGRDIEIGDLFYVIVKGETLGRYTGADVPAGSPMIFLSGGNVATPSFAGAFAIGVALGDHVNSTSGDSMKLSIGHPSAVG